mmetsp:Transcript_29733/g.97900  ORF Transcript_29733/g.97900 Transcript_29733/m.97900 type:complete len:229 (-) Transcript_29733:465-1151(-)
MHAATPSRSSVCDRPRSSSAAREDRASNAADAARRRAPAEAAVAAGVRTATATGETRSSSSVALLVTTLAQSCSGKRSGGSAYSYWMQSPYGPTITTRPPHRSSSASLPHQTTPVGGRGACVWNSDKFRARSEEKTWRALVEELYAATSLRDGDGTRWQKGPDVSSWSWTSRSSSRRMVRVLVATRARGTPPGAVGSTAVTAVGGAASRGSASGTSLRSASLPNACSA